jgi:ADP-L-glycero-D-manno-heptose 6-epimerase
LSLPGLFARSTKMIIVTGANGFIGSAMVWELNQAGYNDIICVDTIGLETRNCLKGRKFSHFLSEKELWPFLESDDGKKVAGIFHMGACSSTTEMNIAFLTENNLNYTKKVWQFCTLQNIPMIYASSAAVYGNGSKGFDDNDSPDIFSPMNPYGESKAAFDRWAVQQTTMPPAWYGLRFFNVYGPNEYFKGDQASLIMKAHHQIRSTEKLKLFRSHNPKYKDGESFRDFVYVKDVTRWMLELFNRKMPASGIYNMGSGKARSWNDLASAVFQTLAKPVVIDWIDIPEDIRPHYQYFTEAKMAKLFSIGTSRPAWSLERGVSDYIKKYLDKGSSLQKEFL